MLDHQYFRVVSEFWPLKQVWGEFYAATRGKDQRCKMKRKKSDHFQIIIIKKKIQNMKNP